MVTYRGAPWRSRYLRAPKAALRLSERDDYAPLSALGTVRLGLKTGADGFFLLHLLDAGTEDGPTLGMRPRGAVRVKGLGGWEGWLDRRDLLPVVRNPHELQHGESRLLAIPRQTKGVYLFPREGKPDQHLAEYVRYGEQEDVHRQQLVRQNGGSAWYRQARLLVRPSWVLPYNSAYDYGAWANPHGAVINGRFIGVTARDGVPEDLLGAVLNSTWVMAARLLEGVATGTEGAYDVGPVAARLMRVPDPRRFQPDRVDGVRAAFQTLVSANRMAPPPDRHGGLNEARHVLDLAVMMALGESAGEASALAGSLYESYARWRQAVEDVERRMRQFRGAMARSGLGRGATPTVAAARRVWDELAADFPALPRELIPEGESLESVDVAGRLAPLESRPLFDGNLVATKEGMSVDLGSWERARYLYMLAALGFRSPYAVPVSGSRANDITAEFEAAQERLEQRARERARYFVGEKAVDEVVDGVIRHWHKKCRSAGQGVTRVGLIH